MSGFALGCTTDLRVHVGVRLRAHRGPTGTCRGSPSGAPPTYGCMSGFAFRRTTDLRVHVGARLWAHHRPTGARRASPSGAPPTYGRTSGFAFGRTTDLRCTSGFVGRGERRRPNPDTHPRGR